MDEKKKYYSEKDVEAIFDSESMVVANIDGYLAAGITEERARELFPGFEKNCNIPASGAGSTNRFVAQTRPGGIMVNAGERVTFFTLAGFKLAAAWYNLTMLEKEIRAAEFASGATV